MSTIQNFFKETITRNWTATTGDFNISTKPTVSSGYLTLSPNNTTLREIIRYTATGTNAFGDFVTVSVIGDRGLGGTTAQTHTIGETIRMNITAQHWADMQGDIDSIVAGGVTVASANDIILGTDNVKVVTPLGLKDSGLVETRVATISLSSADILGMYATPIELIASPGVGKLILVDNILVSLTAGVTAYTGGGTLRTNYTGSTLDISIVTFPAATITSATSRQDARSCYGTAALGLSVNGNSNTALLFTNITGAFLTGNGTAKVFIQYRIVTL